MPHRPDALILIFSISMNSRMGLTQKEIGQRIMELRKAKGWSQGELAKGVGISRPSMAQIELGNRGVDVSELQLLASLLEFSIDEFLSGSFPPSPPGIPPQAAKKKAQRLSIPGFQAQKFKNILLYILERCAGKPNVGETVIYKLLYFSDFNYYELYEEHLTGAKYRKLPFGPVPQKLSTIIGEMVESRQLQRMKTQFYDYPQTRYIPLQKADLTTLKASEKEVIDKVLSQMSDWSASAISKYSHRDIPWLATREGEEIDYELVFYREAPFSVRNYGSEME